MTHNKLQVSMMLMHCIHGNGTIKVVSGENVAEVSCGVYSVNNKEVLRSSTIGFKNQRRIQKLMLGLINKHGSFIYESYTFTSINGELWSSNTPSKEKPNIKSASWG